MIVRKVTAPFKGICQQCKKRTLVRLYPYNESKWFEVLCKFCFQEFDNAMAEYRDYYEEDYD